MGTQLCHLTAPGATVKFLPQVNVHLKVYQVLSFPPKNMPIGGLAEVKCTKCLHGPLQEYIPGSHPAFSGSP